MPRLAGLLLVALLVPGVAAALPDLAPELYGLRFDANETVGPGDVAEGCAGATTGRLLLRFGIRFRNVGEDALVVGSPGCPNCAASPGAVCRDPRFICSPADGHNHPHLVGFADYALLDPRGNVLRLGGKKSFCIRDFACPSGPLRFDCDDQGISPGCLDDYEPSLGCQYIDVTDLPDATRRALRLRATLDPDARLPDADRRNNSVELFLPGCGDGVLQPDEECEPGGIPPDPCCRDDCTMVRTGERCGEPPPGPCGRPDAPFPDGTPCGSSGSPCLAQTCAGGACDAFHPTGDGCLVGAACVPARTPNPVDPCQRCEPARSTTGWSLNVDPDPIGLRCQVARIGGHLGALRCPARGPRAIAVRLQAMTAVLERRQAASGRRAVRLERRLRRQLARLMRAERRAARLGCDVATIAPDLDMLAGQMAAFLHRTE